MQLRVASGAGARSPVHPSGLARSWAGAAGSRVRAPHSLTHLPRTPASSSGSGGARADAEVAGGPPAPVCPPGRGRIPGPGARLCALGWAPGGRRAVAARLAGREPMNVLWDHVVRFDARRTHTRTRPEPRAGRGGAGCGGAGPGGRPGGARSPARSGRAGPGRVVPNPGMREAGGKGSGSGFGASPLRPVAPAPFCSQTKAERFWRGGGPCRRPWGWRDGGRDAGMQGCRMDNGP